MMSIKEKYDAMSPASSKIARAIFLIVGLIAVYGLFSLLFGSGEEVEVEEAEKSLVSMEMTSEADQTLSDKIVIQREIDDLRQQMRIEIDAVREENETLRIQNEMLQEQLNQSSPTEPVNDSSLSYPPPPDTSATPPQLTGELTIETIGGIRRITATQPIPEEDETKKHNYFTTTAYMKGILLNGLYAPTLSKGKSSPHPAFIRVDDLSLLPNEFRRDIEGCEFMGEAVGELSDSRVHIRLTKLACTAYDGSKYFDGDVKGVVFGEDGTLGIPGDIVANFNDLLLHSFFMESLAGVGTAIQAMTTTTVVSSDGTTQEYVEGSGWDKAGRVMVSAGGEGLGKGFSMMSEFYLNILNEMTPVIQIHGGRQVEIKLTEGVELELQNNSWNWGELF